MQNTLSYYSGNLKKDLPAGLVVFLVALPLCLGIALASGAPPLAGIITGLVGGLIVAWLSGSALSVSGPAAGLTVIVLDGIKHLGNYETFLLAGFIAGIVQLALGFLKAGVIGFYFPSAVIRGMLAAIGLTLILKQIPHFVGADEDFFGEMAFNQPDGRTTLSAIGEAWEHIQPGSLIVGLLSLAILVAWESKRVKSVAALKLVPGALIVVAASIVANLVFKYLQPELAVPSSHMVRLPVFDSIGAVTREFRSPDWSQIGNSAVYVTAFTIAIIASLETLLSLEAVDKLDPHKRVSPPNRELKAQGVGNMVAALIGGIPLTAVIVRSSANVDAGGQTRIASVFHGVLLLLSVLFLASVLNLIPLSALAAVLLMVGYKLTKPSLIKAQFKLGWNQFLPFLVTIVAVLFTDLLIGVSVGLLIGIFFILKANYEMSHLAEEEEHGAGQVLRIQLSENVTFLNKASIARVLSEQPDGAHVIIDGSKSTFIDYDVLEVIQNFKVAAAERNIRLDLIGIREVAVLAH